MAFSVFLQEKAKNALTNVRKRKIRFIVKELSANISLFYGKTKSARKPYFQTAYFRKTKKTARMRQMKAARWFHWKACPRKRNIMTIVKTVKEITS